MVVVFQPRDESLQSHLRASPAPPAARGAGGTPTNAEARANYFNRASLTNPESRMSVQKDVQLAPSLLNAEYFLRARRLAQATGSEVPVSIGR